jgi:hypothetical protein
MATAQVIRREIQNFSDNVLAEAMGKAIAEIMRERDERIAALEARIVKLEVRDEN